MRTILFLFLIFAHSVITFGQPSKENPGQKKISNKRFALGDTRWTFKTKGKVFASPVIVNDVLFIGSEDQNL